MLYYLPQEMDEYFTWLPNNGLRKLEDTRKVEAVLTAASVPAEFLFTLRLWAVRKIDILKNDRGKGILISSMRRFLQKLN